MENVSLQSTNAVAKRHSSAEKSGGYHRADGSAQGAYLHVTTLPGEIEKERERDHPLVVRVATPILYPCSLTARNESAGLTSRIVEAHTHRSHATPSCTLIPLLAATLAAVLTPRECAPPSPTNREED